MRLPPKIPWPVLLCLSLASCTSPSTAERELRVTVARRPIINGHPATDSRFDPIVGLYHESGVMCSGTLITRRVVLTAAHCVDGLSASGYSVFFGTDMNGAGTWIGVAEIWEHPGYALNESDPSRPTTLNDIALLRLDRDAPANVQPIPHLPASLALTSADVGIPLTFVGFGKTETGSVGRKLYIEGNLGYVCDGPGNCTYNGMILGPHYIGFSEQAGGPCSGDSGGPALVTRNGQWYVSAVASFVDVNCSYAGASTKVDAYQREIDDFIGSSVPEDCTNGVDDDSDGLADCADSECGSSPYCSGPTACQQATSLTCGASLTGDTAGGSLRFWHYACPGPDLMGPERAYQFSIPMGTTVTVTMTPTGGQDLDLLVVAARPDGSCDLDSCLASSRQAGTATEQLQLTLQQGAYVVVDSPGSSGGSYQLQVSCGTPATEDCSNGRDDDSDGLTDCADPDCAAACSTEDCSNGRDDDSDGLTDCADPDCAAACGIQTDLHVTGGCRTGGSSPGGWFVVASVWALIRRRKSRTHRA